MEGQIIRTEYSEVMQKSYIDYAMSVIVSRALPDVRDGLKPVQRRTLYDMYELGIRYDRPYRKCARIVGDTMGKYHPHGDSSIYDALVVMAQDFKKGQALVDGHGNFGSIEGDGAAAMRYTEARLEKITQEVYLSDMDKNVVDFDLTKNTKVPDDCSLLILYSPAADITENEYKYLSTYLKNGGKAIFLLNYTVDTPYYNKLLKDYGINVQSGYVLDPDNYFASYGSGAYMLLTPQVSKDSDLTSDLSTKDVLSWYSKGMTADKKVRSTLTVQSVLTTSDKSYARKISDKEDTQDLEKKDSDQAGPFSVAMTAEDKYAENTKGEGHATKIFAIGSVAFMDVPNSSYGETTSIIGTQMAEQYNNRAILVNALKWLVGDGGDEIKVLNIPDRSLLEETVQLNSGDITFWTALLVVVLPLALLLCGFLIWNRRRKK